MITAPSHNNPYLQMMEKQLEDMDQAQEAFVLIHLQLSLEHQPETVSVCHRKG